MTEKRELQDATTESFKKIKFKVEKKLPKRKISSQIKLNEEPIEKSTDLMLLKVLNKFVFYLFCTSIMFLNICCLYVLPFMIKEPLSIDDFE